MDKRKHGEYIEDRVRRYLERGHLRHIASNYRCRWGEVDLIMRDKRILVFVEVRFRSREDLVSGAESIDQRKQKKLCRTALHYLCRHTHSGTVARFDVVSVTKNVWGLEKINWIVNAFECS